MYSFIVIIAAVGAFLPLASAILYLRELDDPVQEYIQRMCYPTLGDPLRSLANSPFPCEQQLYIEEICIANGTQEVDFLAEQECFCNGSFWEVVLGCDNCYRVHGDQEVFTAEEASSFVASISTAECSPNPPLQPFTDLFPVINFTALIISESLAPNLTLVDDRFPNNTAVSNYFTATGSLTAGAITGSATARLTIFTNTSKVRFTPSSTPASATGTSTSASKSSASSNAGQRGGVKIVGGVFAAGLGIIAVL
jgi:hypothetical protein